MAQSIWTTTNNQLDLHLHPGQSRGWQSTARFVCILAGTQGGKTSFLPWLLWKEILRCGPGDYIAGTASYDLLKLKFLPSLRDVFEDATRWGRYWAADRIIELSDPATGQFLASRATDKMWARIILRSAESKGGLESATAKAAILDEAGLPSFTLETWEALLRRLSLARGRVFLGTTIYDLGWLKTALYDPWRAAGRTHPDIDIIQFDSALNPSFPREEFERAKAMLPRWKFNMFYRGRYSRPAGQIYSSFKRRHRIAPFPIPPHWPRYVGLDFGGVHTAAVFLALDPSTGVAYLYRIYLAGSRSAKQHVAALRAGEPAALTAVGGTGSEDQWRREFRLAGLAVLAPPVTEVEVGIDRVFAAHATNRLFVFDTPETAPYLEQKLSYSREVDSRGEPTELIKNKSSYHYLDAERYIVSYLLRDVPNPAERQRSHSMQM